MSLNPFPVTDLRLQVELMHYCAYADIIVMFEANGIGQTPSLRERYIVFNENI